jgi:uridine phosphorylase
VLENMEENAFLVPNKAMRDEGTSYHYLPASRFVDISKDARSAIEKALKNHHLNYTEVTTWSTDGFFRETREKVDYRKSEGCSVVEMECAALAACAEMRGAVWGELLFTADTLADAEHYDERNWGGDSINYALDLCVESVLNM